MTVASPTVCVFALQGDVREHVHVLEALGARTRPVRRPADLQGLDGIVFPGGESSVMDRLARITGLKEPLAEAIRGGLPAYGTCAGMILLARQIENPAPGQGSLGVLDVTVRRNAFGAQVDSFEEELSVPAVSADPVHAVFIRAPAVLEAGDDVEVLGRRPGSARGRACRPCAGHELPPRGHRRLVLPPGVPRGALSRAA